MCFEPKEQSITRLVNPVRKSFNTERRCDFRFEYGADADTIPELRDQALIGLSNETRKTVENRPLRQIYIKPHNTAGNY